MSEGRGKTSSYLECYCGTFFSFCFSQILPMGICLENQSQGFVAKLYVVLCVLRIMENIYLHMYIDITTL